MTSGGIPNPFSNDPSAAAGSGDDEQIVVVNTDGEAQSVAEMVEQPAKVMRIGTMIKQLLEEVRAAPLDEASRNRLRDIHQTSIRELEGGLAPELREELERLALPFSDDATPRMRNCGSRRPNSSAGSKVCSTGSRPRCSLSRWRRGPSWSRCARARCRRAWAVRAVRATATTAQGSICSAVRRRRDGAVRLYAGSPCQ